MGRFVNVGFGNMVNMDRIISIISSDSAPAKRIIQSAKENSKAIDATQGRRTRALIITDDDHIIMSALLPETIAERDNAENILQ